MASGAAAFDADAWLRARGQAWIDRRLAESTAARDALRELDGRSFAIRLVGPDLEILLGVNGGRLLWLDSRDLEPDARLVATPLDAVALARSRSLSDLKRTDARLDGNIRVAERFAAALGFLIPDPEGELADWVGDSAAHGIATAVRGLFGLFERTARSLEQDAAEFLHEEEPMLARRFEVEEFVESVDDLREAVDRAEARLAALERRPRGRTGR